MSSPHAGGSDWGFAVRDGADAVIRRLALHEYVRARCLPGSDPAVAALIYGELINNAIHHAPGPVWVRLVRSAEHARLIVEDLGPGPGRVPRAMPHPYAESGRGLTIVRELALSLRIERRVPFGTVATAELPIAFADPPPQGESAAVAAGRAAFANFEFERWLDRHAERLAERIGRSLRRELSILGRASAAAHVMPRLEPALRSLAAAIGIGAWELWVRDARWAFFAIAARGVDAAVVRRCWNRILGVLALNVPRPYASTIAAIAEALDQPEDQAPPPATLLAQRWFDALGDAPGPACDVVRDRLADGVPVASLYADLIAPAQHESGRRWERAEMTIAEEHRRTALAFDLVAQLHAPGERRTPRAGTLLAACAPGEQHELGLRMIANLAESAAWNVVYLGGNLPGDEIFAAACAHRPDVVALSATTSAAVCALAPLIEGLRSAPQTRDTAILVGGEPFVRLRDLWRIVGADASAPDAGGVIDALARFAVRAPVPAR